MSCLASNYIMILLGDLESPNITLEAFVKKKKKGGCRFWGGLKVIQGTCLAVVGFVGSAGGVSCGI